MGVGRNISIVKLIYALCGGVLLAFTIASLLLLQSAGEIADRERLIAERELVRNEIQRQIDIVARDQSQISNWDATLVALGAQIDTDFVQGEIAEWLWEDFDIEHSIIVGPTGDIRISVQRDRITSPQDSAPILDQNQDLVTQAVSNYMTVRSPQDQGYTVLLDPVRSQQPIYASAIRNHAGKPYVIIAQAIVPDDEFTLDTGMPHVLLTMKPILAADLETMRKKVGLASLTISSSPPVPQTESTQKLEIGMSGYQVYWQSTTPSSTIWSQALPKLGILLILIASGLLVVSKRYAKIVDELERSEAKNKFLAMHDALTGLPNRLQFDQELEKIVSAAQQDRCAILCLDLDRFKAVNDTWGHHAGDVVLRTIAGRVLDLVGESGTVARIGGDEFIILLRDQLDHQLVLGLSDQIIKSVCEEVHFDGGSANVGASIGVAWWPDDAKTAKTIIRSADEALYRAKENGRGQVQLAAESNKPLRSPKRGKKFAA